MGMLVSRGASWPDVTVHVLAGNFLSLVKEGFYDGIHFHRVIKDFMLQVVYCISTGQILRMTLSKPCNSNEESR